MKPSLSGTLLFLLPTGEITGGLEYFSVGRQLV